MVKRTPFGVRIDVDLQHRIRTHADEIDEKLYREVENALEEYLDRDRYARIEEELRTLRELIENESALSVEDGTHTHTDRDRNDSSYDINPDLDDDWLDNLDPDLQNGLMTTWKNIIKIGEAKTRTSDVIDQSEFKRAVHQAGRVDDRTVENYKQLFTSNGWLLPHPIERDGEKWVCGPGKFAYLCENAPEVSPEIVVELVDKLEMDGKISAAEYREALADDYIENNELKIDYTPKE